MKTLIAILKDIYGFLFDVMTIEARVISAAVILALVWWWKGWYAALIVAAVGLWIAIAVIAIVFAFHVAQDMKKRREKLGA